MTNTAPLTIERTPLRVAMNVRPYTGRDATPGDWTIETTASLTDDQAAAITWRADPEQVVLGAFVEVVDYNGTRIGRVVAATHHERIAGPSYVVCALELR